MQKWLVWLSDLTVTIKQKNQHSTLDTAKMEVYNSRKVKKKEGFIGKQNNLKQNLKDYQI